MKRFRQLEFLLCLAVLATISPRISHAADTGDALIKGVSDFLLDRANDNYVYIFQRKLESNEVFKKYLPATYRVAKAGDLRSLLTNRGLWKTALEDDLETGKKTFLGRVLEDVDNLIEKKLCTGERAKELEEPCKEARQALKDARSRIAGAAPAAQPPEPRERASLAMTAFKASAQTKLTGDVLRDLKYELDQVRTETCRKVTVEEEKAGKKRMYTACVIQILALLDAFARADYTDNCFLMGNWCWNDQRDKKVREENDDFDDFKRFVIFFAQMADAAETNDPDRVKALLKSVTVPPVSFGIKREPHRTRVLITAYLGGAWVKDKDDRSGAIVAPIGFEISQARGSGNSLSLLVSPVHFGYPLSLKMRDTEATVKTSDIVVPSAYVLWGPKNYPLAGGLGYARVRSIDTPGTREGRWLLFVGFDMPLFRLH